MDDQSYRGGGGRAAARFWIMSGPTHSHQKTYSPYYLRANHGGTGSEVTLWAVITDPQRKIQI
ncbi:MAG: hypothetical protein U0401_01410 [Anaerolineae bacterium]